MTWSYNLADLATSEKDQVRLEVGDTDVNRQLLQDEEIDQFITVERNFWAAAARACEAISRLFMSRADVRLGRSMQIAYVKMAGQYTTMACKLRAKALGTTPPWVGGMSVSDKIAYNQDSDLVAPLFSKTMQENPWTGGYTSDSLGPAPVETDDSGAFD